jgi:Lrp/AsnC family transcriptional regulator, leucine-responsive regulatory protein
MIANRLVEESLRITGNERKVMKMLLDNARTSDVEIGERLKITPQGANKIRKKLEETGIIKEYVVDIDYASLGVTTFALVLMDVPYDKKTDEGLIKRILPENVISLYRIVRNGVSHIAFCGFRDVYELDKCLNSVNLQNEDVKIKKIYVFPIQKLIKHSMTGLMADLVKNYGKSDQQAPSKIQFHESSLAVPQATNLTKNEKNILSALIKDGKMRYNDISKGFEGITNRAVSNIKERLEKKNVIKKYTAVLDIKKMGINLVAFFFIKTKPDYREYKEGFYKWIKLSPNVIGGYHLNEENLHVISAAFKDLGELEEYSHQFHALNNGLFDIDQIYVTSPKGIIKDSPKDLFASLLK